VPEAIDLNEFHKQSLSELQKIATEIPARVGGGIPKTQLIYKIMYFYVANGTTVICGADGLKWQKIAIGSPAAPGTPSGGSVPAIEHIEEMCESIR